MRRLTSVELSALKPSDWVQRIKVDKGLQLRISSSGERCWVVRYSIEGKEKEYRLPKAGLFRDICHLAMI